MGCTVLQERGFDRGYEKVSARRIARFHMTRCSARYFRNARNAVINCPLPSPFLSTGLDTDGSNVVDAQSNGAFSICSRRCKGGSSYRAMRSRSTVMATARSTLPTHVTPFNAFKMRLVTVGRDPACVLRRRWHAGSRLEASSGAGPLVREAGVVATGTSGTDDQGS